LKVVRSPVSWSIVKTFFSKEGIYMGKIDDYVKANNCKPKELVYHTWRDVKNSQKKPTGKMRVLVDKDMIARVEYACPECKHQAYAEQPWKRPFSIKCAKCSFKITVPKMKNEAKREAKSKPAEDSSNKE